MVNYFIYARDCSFSTYNNVHYHSNGLKTLEQFKRDVDAIKEEDLIAGCPPTESRIVYLHWGDDCWEVDEDETRKAYLELECEQMGTDPEWIIRYLKNKYTINKNDNIKLLYIITDGLINNERAKKCFRWNEFMHYQKVVFHAFNEDLKQIDLSVAASFFKSRCKVYRNYELYVCTDILEEFDYDKINSYNFTVKKDQLKSYITLKFINEFKVDAVALQEIIKLEKLRQRLLDELELETAKLIDRVCCKSLIDAVIMMKVDIEKSISALINYIVSDTKSYSFEALKFDIEFDKYFEEQQFDDVDFTAQEFEIFNFILDDDVGMPSTNKRIVDATWHSLLAAT